MLMHDVLSFVLMMNTIYLLVNFMHLYATYVCDSYYHVLTLSRSLMNDGCMFDSIALWWSSVLVCSVMTMLIHYETCGVLMIVDLLVYYDDSVRTAIYMLNLSVSNTASCWFESLRHVNVYVCNEMYDSRHLNSVVVQLSLPHSTSYTIRLVLHEALQLDRERAVCVFLKPVLADLIVSLCWLQEYSLLNCDVSSCDGGSTSSSSSVKVQPILMKLMTGYVYLMYGCWIDHSTLTIAREHCSQCQVLIILN